MYIHGKVGHGRKSFRNVRHPAAMAAHRRQTARNPHCALCSGPRRGLRGSHDAPPRRRPISSLTSNDSRALTRSTPSQAGYLLVQATTHGCGLPRGQRSVPKGSVSMEATIQPTAGAHRPPSHLARRWARTDLSVDTHCPRARRSSDGRACGRRAAATTQLRRTRSSLALGAHSSVARRRPQPSSCRSLVSALNAALAAPFQGVVRRRRGEAHGHHADRDGGPTVWAARPGSPRYCCRSINRY